MVSIVNASRGLFGRVCAAWVVCAVGSRRYLVGSWFPLFARKRPFPRVSELIAASNHACCRAVA